jgi:mannosyltransferase
MDLKRIGNWVTEISARSWFNYDLLFLITLFAAALRFYKLGEWSFWIDEIFTINHAMAHFSTPELILQNTPPTRNWVPVSVILTAQVLNALGVSEWSARLASTVIGIVTIPILYIPTKKMFGSHVALLAMLLLAVSPWHIFWSQNARFYTSLMLFYSLALFAFYFGIEEDEPKYLFLFFILVYLATSERLMALFIFPAVVFYLAALWILKFEKPKGINIRNITIIGLPILIGGLVELYSRIVKGESRFFADFNWFTQYQIDDPFRLLVFIGNNLGIPLMVMAIFSGIILVSKKSRPGLLMFVSAVGILNLLVISNIFIFTKDRYMFVTLFSWIILMVIGISEIAYGLKGNFRWLTLGFFLVFFAHAANDALLYYHANHGNRLQWKSAFSIVKERVEEEDVIVAFWPEFDSYYIDREITAYAEVSVNTLLESDKRYWFVLDSETIWINGDTKLWLENNAELINVWYLRRPEDNSLRLYLFDPAQNIDP